MNRARFGPSGLVGKLQMLAVALVAMASAGLVGCVQESAPTVSVELIDSVLVELGGAPAGALTRSQRWRLIGSIGPGLPPPGFDRENLPEPDSRSAGLMQAYCLQCHWMAAPQMHSAAEWGTLLRRMYVRAQTLGSRMGGPLTTELVGSEFAMTGMGASIIPGAEDQDSLLAYVTRYALPVADPSEVAGPEAAQYVQTCSQCHETPSPTAHTPEEWDMLLIRMDSYFGVMGVEPMTDAEREEIRAFLGGSAGD
jgi:cytochrome c5